MARKTLDVICLGRLGVDLYAQQIGARLEDVSSTGKYLGGSSGNMALGTARLGLKSAMLTRLGDEQMGRFLAQELASAGCDISQIQYDKERLTGLVLLGIKDRDTFPLIFYRDNVADMEIDTDLINEDFIASAKALVITGTHLSTEDMDAACHKAIAFARRNNTKVVLDIDYRPVLWGLTGKGEGENRFIADDNVTAHVQSALPLFDLIVGTEEEIHIAGGSQNTIECLRRIRRLSDAEIVVKRGPAGASWFDQTIPDRLDDGFTVQGVPVEVLNVLGAGDAFMSGFLRGWIRNEGPEKSLRYANACGALVVSRHGCAPAMPTEEELMYFMENQQMIARPDRDKTLNYLHRVTTRKGQWQELCVLAFDHRKQLHEMAKEEVGHDQDVGKLKSLILSGARLGAETAGLSLNGKYNPGVLCDESYGQDTLNEITGSGWWIGRPVELPGSRPLEFEKGMNIGLHMNAWPREHVVKCLTFYHPDDPVELRLQQERRVQDLYEACCLNGHELLLEVIPPPDSEVNDETLERVMTRFYNLDVYPDWWKLPPQTPTAWKKIDSVINRYAPHCRGIVLLGLEQPAEELEKGFNDAAHSKWVKGFMIGRSIFGEPARAWFRQELDNEQFVQAIANRYQHFISLWQQRHNDYGNNAVTGV